MNSQKKVEPSASETYNIEQEKVNRLQTQAICHLKLTYGHMESTDTSQDRVCVSERIRKRYGQVSEVYTTNNKSGGESYNTTSHFPANEP